MSGDSEKYPHNGLPEAEMDAEMEGPCEHVKLYYLDAARQPVKWDHDGDCLLCKLHQLSEDHSHCEDLLHELGARASAAESRLHKLMEELRFAVAWLDWDEHPIRFKAAGELVVVETAPLPCQECGEPMPHELEDCVVDPSFGPTLPGGT